MDHRERVARAICLACDENPEHVGDASGNDKRWQDYLHVADAAIEALAGDGVLVRLERPEGSSATCHGRRHRRAVAKLRDFYPTLTQLRPCQA
jgi:hypothetical protein